MTPQELKILMLIKNVRAVDLAKRLNVTSSCVWMIRNGHGRSSRIETAIAKACGHKREDIFPIIPEPRYDRATEAA